MLDRRRGKSKRNTSRNHSRSTIQTSIEKCLKKYQCCHRTIKAHEKMQRNTQYVASLQQAATCAAPHNNHLIFNKNKTWLGTLGGPGISQTLSISQENRGLMYKDLDFLLKQMPSYAQKYLDVWICADAWIQTFPFYIPINMELSAHVGAPDSSLSTPLLKYANHMKMSPAPAIPLSARSENKEKRMSKTEKRIT